MASQEHEHRREDLFRLLVLNLKDYAICALDLAGAVITWNEGAREITGYTELEIVGKHFSKLYASTHANDKKPDELLKQALSIGRIEQEVLCLRKDGVHFAANLIITPLFDASGEAVGHGLLIRDLSEGRLAKERFRQSERTLEATVGAIEEYAIFLLDPQGFIQTWNRGAQRIKGWTADEIIGKHFSVFYPEEARIEHHPDYELKQAVQNGYYEEENWRIRKDGSRFWALVNITSIKDENGELQGFVKVTRDLTRRKIMESELLTAKEQAQEASKLKSQFVANVSHEVRTPLAGIIGMAELLVTDKSLNEEQMEAAQHIFTSAERLLEVLNDILDFSKLESGRVELHESRFSLAQLIRDVCESIGPAAMKKGIHVCCLVDEGLPTHMIGDELKIRQGLLNLAHNAVKFTKEGSVDVMAQLVHRNEREARVRFVVKDTGVGISKDAQKKLFQPFVQADGTISRRYAGTGLGLSITKGYVTLMRGEIGYESEPGLGSEFWFSVPLKLCAEAA